MRESRPPDLLLCYNKHYSSSEERTTSFSVIQATVSSASRLKRWISWAPNRNEVDVDKLLGHNTKLAVRWWLRVVILALGFSSICAAFFSSLFFIDCNNFLRFKYKFELTEPKFATIVFK